MRLANINMSILANAYCGKLVQQDPNDESASAVLDRIKLQAVNTTYYKWQHDDAKQMRLN